jgi:hypothetical protein
MGVHHIVQKQGRSEVLQDYHLRIGDVTADTDAPKEAPVHEQRFDETEIGAAKLATLTEITPQHDAAFRSHIDVISALSLDTEHAPSDFGDVVDALLERQMKFCAETDGRSLKRVFTVG